MGGGNPVAVVTDPIVNVISPVTSPVADVLAPIVAPIVAPVVALVSPPPPPPEPCEGSWSDYGPCSTSCDGGTQTRSWTTTKNPKHGGTACPSPTTQSRQCNTNPCPVNCAGSWSDYGGCNVTCGGGTQTSTWTTTTAPAHGGTACPSPTTKSRQCNTDPCPVDCVGSWSDYNTCNQPCGGGTQTRSWTTITPSAHGGTACPSPTMELRECNIEPCPTPTGPSMGPSPDSTDTDTDNNILYIGFVSILSVCCCMLVLVLILSMGKKPSSRPRRFRR
jgi:hypothetical protein